MVHIRPRHKSSCVSVQNLSHAVFRLSHETSFSVPFVPGSFFKDAERWYKEDARIALQSAIRSDSRTMRMRDADHIEVPKLYDICAKIQQVQRKHHMTRRPGHRRLARHGFLLPRSRLPDKYPSDFSLQRSALQTWTCGRNCRSKPSGKLISEMCSGCNL